MAEHVGWDQLAHATLRRGGVLLSGGLPASVPRAQFRPSIAACTSLPPWGLAPGTSQLPVAQPVSCRHAQTHSLVHTCLAVRTGFFRARAVLTERGARVGGSVPPPKSSVGFFSLGHHLSFYSLSEQGWEVCCFVNCMNGSCPESESDALRPPDWKGEGPCVPDLAQGRRPLVRHQARAELFMLAQSSRAAGGLPALHRC